MKSHKIKQEDIDSIKIWLNTVENHGWEVMSGDPRWRDHRLDRELWRYRSSSFSKIGRIVYELKSGVIEILDIAGFTHNHDYKKIAKKIQEKALKKEE